MKGKFKQVYGESDHLLRQFYSPGRVNLIGEHTDYNGGHVFPCALSLGTYGIIRLREDKVIKLFSENIINGDVIEIDFDTLHYDETHGWANYPKGVIKALIESDFHINKGFEIYIWSTLPKASGLSSSASLEVLIGFMMKHLFDLNISLIDLALLCKDVENNYIGVNCGILDQFAVSMGKKDNAILLDCNTLKYEYVPLVLKDISIVLAHTNKERGLIDSKYNERRRECDEAVGILREHIEIETLGDLNLETFNRYSKFLDGVILKRARHGVLENIRTLEAKEALTMGNIRLFGELMKESHISLKDNFDVTGIELDTLARLAWDFKGCIGARMTGAGFGGCTVNLVKTDMVPHFTRYIIEEYEKYIGYPCRIYTSDVGNGPMEIC